MNKLLASSVDPKDLSLTIKGLLLSSVPIVMLLLQAAGKQIQQDEISLFVQVVSDIIAGLGALASAVMVAFGMARKLYVAFRD